MNKTERLVEFKKQLVAAFGGGCSVCGYNKCLRALQFHHADPDEKLDWERKRGGVSLAEVERNPHRFVLLCANHHFEKHAELDEQRGIHLDCKVCGKPYLTRRHKLINGAGLTCSKKCGRESMVSKNTKTLTDRLMRYVEVRDECWAWTGYTVNGAPALNVLSPNGKRGPATAAKLAYEIRYGQVPPGTIVYRRCTTPGCINPEHHAVGSKADAGAVRARDDRTTRGERSGHTRLDDEKVREILRKYDGRRGAFNRLSEEYGVTRHVIAAVVHRKTWKHIKAD